MKKDDTRTSSRGWIKKTIALMLVGSLLLVITGCLSEDTTTLTEPAPTGTSTEGVSLSSEIQLRDRDDLYSLDKQDSVVHFYITVTENNLTNVPRARWSHLSQIRSKEWNEVLPQLDIILQEGDAEGPSSGYFGYGDILPNATATIRGASTRSSAQKSYKIKLTDKAGLWREHRTINLIKHPYDITRVANKLSFDLFQDIPDFTSLRTQFVRLHVKDLTAPNPVDEFVDYGFYTQIEQPNKQFLRMHGLDPNGHLYKAVMFEFQRYPEQLKLEGDPTYDLKQFERVLEPKGSKDHAKLLKMLDDVNDSSKNIEEVFEKHFDPDNYFTWLAINILLNNMDTNSQNFFLYSPLNGEKWYFLPWDYDGGWRYDEWRIKHGDDPEEKWKVGISNYWNVVLHNRVLKEKKYRDMLLVKLEEVSKILTEERIQGQLDKYKPIVTENVWKMPDIEHMPVTRSEFEEYWTLIPKIPQISMERYKKSLSWPQPFFLGIVQYKDGKMHFNWDPSYDFDGDELRYTFQVSKTPAFVEKVVEKKNLNKINIAIDKLPAGKYYWRVLVHDTQGNEQHAFDWYRDMEGDNHYGVQEIFVK